MSFPTLLRLPRLAICLVFPAAFALAQTAARPSLVIEAGTPAGKVSPIHFGLMTEEINYSYDGGLYAELVRNRAFLDDAGKPVHWSVVATGTSSATIALDPAQPLNEAIPTSLRLEVASASSASPAGIANGGYWGIPVRPSTPYRASFHAKAAPGFSGPVTVSLVSQDGAIVYATDRIAKLTPGWKAYELVLKTGKKVPVTADARLQLTVENPGTVWFGFVSLFPPTWKNRPNGLRPDLMQALIDMKPAFLRFPGGNYLEGDVPETRFEWKKTLGPIASRPGHPSPWGYRSTDGMGLLEFLLWCEDMGAEPVLAVYAGYSLRGTFIKPGPDLEPYVQEALEEIEYVAGPVTTKWGAQRARDGHPKPFRLHYVEIGNEDWFDKSGSYDGRFAQFYDAIKKAYPRLKCISSVGNEQSGKLVHSRRPDVVDEHYYRKAADFLKDAQHFDHYDRKGPEIFVGEWAAHETAFPPWDKLSKHEAPTPNMLAALGDAAFMAAMERNSDFVTMQCYAPLLANVNDYQWRPNLIGYDALKVFGSPSYHAFCLFSQNVGDTLLKATLQDAPDLHASATRDTDRRLIHVKIVNPLDTLQPLKIDLRGLPTLGKTARVQTLAAAPTATNSIADPRRVVPVVTDLPGVKPSFTYEVEPHSITVLTFRMR